MGLQTQQIQSLIRTDYISLYHGFGLLPIGTVKYSLYFCVFLNIKYVYVYIYIYVCVCGYMMHLV